MAEVGTTERSSKAEHRLKIRTGGHLSQFLDLRIPAEPDVDYLFHVSNSHGKVDRKFVTDNIKRVLAGHFEMDVEHGNERPTPREAGIDLGREHAPQLHRDRL